MKKLASLMLTALAFAALALPASAATLAQSAPPTPQLSTGTLTEDVAATVLNEGGKMLVLETLENWVKNDWKIARLEKGETCLLKKGTPVYRDGADKDGIVTVRALTVAAEPGECPLGTKFEIPASKIKAGSLDGERDEDQKKQ